MLWTRILRSFLGIIVLALISAGVTTALLYDKPVEPAMAITAVADFLVHDLDQDTSIDKALRSRASELSIDLALWGEDGQLIAGTSAGLPGPEEDMERHLWVRQGSLRGMVIPLTDGRFLTAAIVDRDEWRGLRYLLVLLVVFGVLGAGSYLLARRLTERLERLTEQVQSVGPDRLDAQVDVDGEDEHDERFQ